jgi:hypothetical protein
MAERTMTICDVDERNGVIVAATSHVRVELNGSVRELDLCEAHLGELNQAVDGLLGAQPAATGRRARSAASSTPTRARGARAGRSARKATEGQRASRRRATSRSQGRRTAAARRPAEQSEQIRDWARAQGMEVKERGRLSNDILQAFAAANPGQG